MQKSIATYNIIEKIYESPHSVIYRAEQKKDNIPVILKILQPANPSPGELNSFQNEYDLTSQFSNDGIITVSRIEEYQNTLIMIEEDISAISLDIWLKQRKLSLKECLYLAIQITETIKHIHEAKVIHKNINPSNIIWNSQTEKAKIIDFGIASRLPSERITLKSPSKLEGTLAYSSPEQTGRINRSIDNRTDLYSLGVTLYEMLSRQLPFITNDAMELVHSHIAKKAIPLSDLNNKIPAVISDLVMKLLEKNPDDRYQSAIGLKYDLEIIYKNLHLPSKIETLKLGEKDFSDKFKIPQKLYGRDKEINILLKSFDYVCSGKSETIFIAAYPGVGKTVLVQEAYSSITEKRGFFAEGKFDQSQTRTPYSAINLAFRQFCRYLMKSSQENLAEWRSKILDVLGDNGQIIIDIIPDLELVIGKQPPVAKLGSLETENRFQMLFINFIKTLSNKEHPFILFIDDLQWIDSASLNLLQTIILDDEIHHLLFVGAYRENEVNETHPLISTIGKIREKGKLNQITLKPLDLKTINDFIADSFQYNPEKTLELAEICYRNTDGNPFFLKQYIFDLIDKSLINFDNEQIKWHWDLSSIRDTECTENVVELILEKILRLPAQTIKLLSYSACIGTQFSINALSIVCKKEKSQLLQDISPAVEAMVIIPLDEIHTAYEDLENRDFHYKFLHDQIRQAALSSIETENIESINYEIGFHLWENYSELELEEHLFKIVDHLNIGITKFGRKEEKEKLAELNFKAGKRAKTSIAYFAAKEYFTKAYDLLSADSWDNNYPLTMQYCLEKGEMEYFISDWETAEATVELAEEKAQNDLDKITVSMHKASMYRKKNDLKLSLDIAIEALNKLGIDINAFPSEKEIGDEISSFIKLSKDLSEEELYNLPELTDPERIIAMSLLYESFAPAYLLGSPLVAIIGAIMSKISIKEGNCSYSSIGYIFLSAITFANILKDFNNAYKFGNLAIKINDQKFHKKEFEACIFDMWGTFVCHHKEPIKCAKKDLLRGFYSGLENGSYQWGVYSGIIYTLMSLWGPGTLKELDAAFDKILPPSRKVEFHVAQWGFAAKATAYNIIEEVEDRTVFSEKAWPDLHSFMESRDVSTMLIDTTCKISLANWFSDLKKSLEYADKGEQYLAGAPGVYFNTVFRFHQALAYTTAFEIIEEKDRSEYLSKIRSIISEFELFAEHNSVTYLHQLLMIKAEMQRIEGNIENAMDLYESAINSAKEGGFLNNEAFACELAARFFYSLKKERIANIYLFEAYSAYEKWGAKAKVIDLETKYSQLLVPEISKQKEIPDASSKQKVTKTSTLHQQTSSMQLDIGSMMKASHILSGEIIMSKLLKKMIHLVIENAGATRGMLILERNGSWFIEAEGSSGIDEITVLQALPLAESKNIPLTVINYISRTKENVVLPEATQEGNFTQDAYIIEQKPMSVLGLPILNHAQLTGILYLENNLTTGAFTEDRLQVINLIASQAGISLENARLFEEKQKNAERLIEEISVRQQAEEELQKSEKKYRQLFESMMPGVVYQDATGAIIDANSSAEKLLGLTLDQMYGRTSIDPRWKSVHEDGSDFPGDTHPAMISLKNGVPIKDVIMGVFNPARAKYNWLNINSIPQFRTGDDRPYLVFTTFDDITERINNEQTIQESNALLTSILESPENIIMFALDTNYNYLGFNKAHVKEMKLAYNAEIEIGQNILNYIPNKGDRKKAEITYKRVLKGERFIEIQEYGEADSRFWYELTFNPIINISGHVSGFTVFVTNITERKRTELNLISSNERLSIALASSKLGIWDLNLITQKLYWSDEIYNLFEKKKRKYIPNFDSFTSQIHPDDLETMQERFNNALISDKTQYKVIVRVINDSGKEWIMEASGKVTRNNKDEAVSILGTAQDITERKQAEKEKEKLHLQLMQSQKLESVGRLAGGVAHDFNNMLAVILGYSEMVMTGVEKSNPIYSGLEQIHDAAKRSSDLTRQLLAFARKQTIAPQILDLNDTISGMMKMLRRLIGEDIDLVWTPGKDNVQVNMDPSQIDQIMVNICINARDAIKDTGRVTIETRKCSIDEEYCASNEEAIPGEFHVLEISDNGCGMDKQTKENIFEPFYTNKQTGQGTGLGLATVFGIIKQNDGFISVYSEPDKGSTFKLYFPTLSEKTVITEKEAQREEILIGNETILVVEDEVVLLEMTKSMLENHGYKILCASSPTKAISLVQEHSETIDLLITDVIMPEMNGRNLAKKIVSLHNNIKCLFMSGYTADVIAHHGVLEPGVVFIQKPFEQKELIKKVREALNKGQDNNK